MESYKLDTGKKYIKDIFASDAFYCIPEYQRPYVWGQEQISILLDDLTTAHNTDKNKEYFVGSMIWNTKTGRSNNIDYTYQDILDGQQRFITFYLLHGIIRDISTDKGLKKKVEKRLRQEEDEFDEIPERNRIHFEIRDDKEFLDQYLLDDGKSIDKESLYDVLKTSQSKSVKNMATALLIMSDWFEKYSKDHSDEDFQSFVKSFFAYISNKVLALYLATPDNLDDAYNLFTVLNSRGMQLQVSDILRAQNLRSIDSHQERKRFAEKWSTFENTIGSPYKGFDDFLWALVFVKMKYRSDDNESLTKAFNFMFSKNTLERGRPTFDFVGKYIEHYEAITNGSISTSETSNLFSNLIFVLNSVFGNQYLALIMHYRECFTEHKILDFLIKIDNLLSVSWLTGKRSIQTRVFIILRKMEEFSKKAGNQSEKFEMAEAFLNSDVLRYDYDDKQAATTINIEDFFEMLDTEEWGSFAGTRINKTRYLLLKLDILQGSITTQLQFNRAATSVEHLMPRKIEGTDWGNIVTLDEHKEWLHRLGNIVMIDRKKNASLSTRIFEEKKERYKSSIETRAHTNYTFMTYEKWNTSCIQKNHTRITDILRSYYTGNSVETFLTLKKSL